MRLTSQELRLIYRGLDDAADWQAGVADANKGYGSCDVQKQDYRDAISLEKRFRRLRSKIGANLFKDSEAQAKDK